jgi:hypothetical protein
VPTNIYFDVDGVLNAQSGRPPRHETGWEGEWSTARISEIAVTWSHELVAAFNELVALPNVNPVWLTSWEDDATLDLCPAIGLNGTDWPVLRGAADDATFAWWKLDAIREDLELSHPDRAIWIDDEFRLDRHAPVWAASAPVWAASAPVWAASSPRMNLGLTRDHIQQIREFLA